MILRKTKLAERLEPVDLGNGETLDVLVRGPSWRDTLNDYGEPSYANTAEHRIQTSIVGWQGVIDEEGQPVPFSFDALVSLCEQNPLLFYKILDVANRAYSGVSDTESKNSDAPPSTASTAAATAELVATP